MKKSLNYLGHVISNYGVSSDETKIEAVNNFPQPTSAQKINEFLGLAGYYRRFISKFAKLTKPLTI